jgi:hypothetical protein
MIDNEKSLLTKPGEVAAKVIDGEAILINLGSGLYYSMGKVGGRVWALIEQNCSVDSIAEVIASEFDVSLDIAKADVRDLANQLVAEGLIGVGGAGAVSAGGSNVEANGGNADYERPELRKFDDMAAMLALDPPLPGVAQAQG